LQQHVPYADVWAYGSRVTGNAHSGSDLDLVLRCTNMPEHRDGYYNLKEALSDSLLPMLVDVHLWSDLPESFHANIQEAYIILQQGKE
jgi:predicted nucleotidyltransferase